MRSRTVTGLSGLILSLGALQALTIGFYLARAKITALLVGPAGVGLIGVIDQVVAVVTQLSLLSLPFASVKYLSAAHSRDHDAFARGFAAFLRAILVVSMIGTAGGVMLVVIRPALLGPDLAGRSWVVALGLLGIPLTGMIGLLTNTMAAAGRPGASALFGLALAASTTALCSAGIWIASLPGYYTGTLLGMLAVVLGGMVYLRRREGLRAHRPGVRVLAEIRRDPATLSFVAASFVSSFTAPLAYLVARYAVLGSLGAVGAGLLQASMGLSLALGSVMRASSAFFLTPAMNRADPVDRKYHTATQYLAGLTVLVCLGALPIVLFPSIWISAVYSAEFTGAAAYVHLFVLSQILLLITGVNSGLLIGLNRIRAHVAITVTGDVVVAGLAWMLVPSLSIPGVGLALIVGAVLSFILTAATLWRSGRLQVYRVLGGYPGLAVLSTAVLGVVASRYMADPLDHLLPKAVVLGILALASLRYLQEKRVGAAVAASSEVVP